MRIVRVLMFLSATASAGAFSQPQPFPAESAAHSSPITQGDKDPSRRSFFEAWAGQFYKEVRRNRENLRSQAPTRIPVARIQLDRAGKAHSIVVERSSGSELYDELLRVLIRESEAAPGPPVELFQPNQAWIELVASFEWRLEPETILVRVAIDDEAWGTFRQLLANEVDVALKAAAKTAITGRSATVEYRVYDGRIESWELARSAGDPQVDATVLEAMALVASRIAAPARPKSVRARLELSMRIE